VTGSARLFRVAIGRSATRGASTACAVVLMGTAWLAPAAAQVSGPEFQVNSFTTDYQGHPAAAAEASGGVVVVWDSEGQDGGARGVFGQRFQADGSPLAAEFAVNTFTTLAQGVSAVAAAGAGDFVVAWTSYQQDGNGAGVFAKRFVAGTPQTEFQVNTSTLGDQKGVAVAADAAGETAIAWWSVGQDGSGPAVVTRRFASTGTPLSAEQIVNSFTTGTQWFPAVAAVGTSEFVVAWESSSQDGSGYGIRARRVDVTGLPSGSEIAVNAFTTGEQNRPAVAADSAGGFVVVWTSAGQDGFGDGVFGRRFDAAGLPQGGDFQINQETLGGQREPAIAADAGGGYLVTWQSFDGDNDGIYGRYLSADGVPASDEFQVNSFTTNYQTRPAIAPAGAGEFLVVWESNLQDGSSLGIYGQRTRRGLFLDSFESSDVCAWSASVGGGIC
jgi:hypothetical protein